MSERHSELRVLRWSERIQDVLAGQVRGPIRANLDLTNLCSHACPWCEPLDFRKATIADKSHTLSYSAARSVLEDLKELDCRAIQFSGGGEPTLHPQFGTLLMQAHEHAFRTLVVTHGGFLDRWRVALLAGADHVRVSLDASREEEHQQMHGSKSGEFTRITENIRALVAARGDAKTPEIGITYNVADCNSGYESIVSLFAQAGDWGVDYVQLRPVSEQTGEFLTKPWAEIVNGVRCLTGFMVPLGPMGFEVKLMGQREKDVFYQREFEKCYASLSLAVIGANGDVCACCDRRDIVFGNVNNARFKAIWLSAIHRERAGQIVPQFCQRCVLCGFNKSVERFVIKNEAVPELI